MPLSSFHPVVARWFQQRFGEPTAPQREGWDAIRAYFARGRAHYPDLVLEPTGDFWARPDGLALLWTMTGTQTDDSLGADLVGRRWTVEGLSYLVFDGLTVVREADYHDKGARERSLRA